MSNHGREGNLAGTPFPQLLLFFWGKKDSGRLWVKNGDEEKNIFLYKGNLALTESFFPEKEFRAGLVKKELLTAQQAEEVSLLAQNKNISLARALIEHQVFSPAQTWELMTEFWLDSLFPLFDWPQGQYIFDETSEPAASQILIVVASLEFILQGIRRMTNFHLIESCLPGAAENCLILSPSYAELLRLAPHERYLLNLLRHVSRPEDLYQQSQLGKRETQRTLFGLIQIGLVGSAHSKNKLRPAAEFSLGETEKIWGDFNDKCSYIYKYISKEIGPVGLNVLEKAIDEVKARFSPPLQNLELRGDGRVDLKPLPFLAAQFSVEENRRSFLRLLNEILVAEILAVKRTLGNEHEAILIRNLERMGEAG